MTTLKTVLLNNNTGFRPGTTDELIKLSKNLIPNSLLEIIIGMETDLIYDIEYFVERMSLVSEIYVVHDSDNTPAAAVLLRNGPTEGTVYVGMFLSNDFKKLHYDFLKIGKKVFDDLGNTYKVAITQGFYRDDVAHEKFLNFFKFRLLDERHEPVTDKTLYTYVRTF